MTNEELFQRFRLLEARVLSMSTLYSTRIGRLERQRAVELHQEGDGALPRIEVLEMRMDSQEASQSCLLRQLAKERHAKIRGAAQVDKVPVRIVKTIGFHLNFTVEEMAKHFEVNPEAISADQYEYAQELANKTITSLLHDEWQPKALAKVEVLSTDIVDIG